MSYGVRVQVPSLAPKRKDRRKPVFSLWCSLFALGKQRPLRRGDPLRSTRRGESAKVFLSHIPFLAPSMPFTIATPEGWLYRPILWGLFCFSSGIGLYAFLPAALMGQLYRIRSGRICALYLLGASGTVFGLLIFDSIEKPNEQVMSKKSIKCTLFQLLKIYILLLQKLYYEVNYRK